MSLELIYGEGRHCPRRKQAASPPPRGCGEGDGQPQFEANALVEGGQERRPPLSPLSPTCRLLTTEEKGKGDSSCPPPQAHVWPAPGSPSLSREDARPVLPAPHLLSPREMSFMVWLSRPSLQQLRAPFPPRISASRVHSSHKFRAIRDPEFF